MLTWHRRNIYRYSRVGPGNRLAHSRKVGVRRKRWHRGHGVAPTWGTTADNKIDRRRVWMREFGKPLRLGLAADEDGDSAEARHFGPLALECRGLSGSWTMGADHWDRASSNALWKQCCGGAYGRRRQTPFAVSNSARLVLQKHSRWDGRRQDFASPPPMPSRRDEWRNHLFISSQIYSHPVKQLSRQVPPQEPSTFFDSSSFPINPRLLICPTVGALSREYGDSAFR
jgi:hypothetical protein